MILYFKSNAIIVSIKYTWITESMFQIYLQVYFSIYLQTIKWNKFWILERFEIYGVFEYEEEKKLISSANFHFFRKIV